jgi:uncharacterized membrane protein YgdD (TMEM256/DUF423 family)
MLNFQKTILLSAILLIFSGIILGAFGAHGLEGKISVEKIESFKTGVNYQMYHGLAFFALAALFPFFNFSLKLIFRLMLIGLLFFSGSIYLLATQVILGLSISRFLGPTTPIGGLLLIISWGILFYKVAKQKV